MTNSLYPLTLFKGFSKQASRTQTLTWPEIVEILSKPQRSASKALHTYFALSDFKNGERSLANLTETKAIILDSDDGYPFNTVKAALDGANINYLMITSWHHNLEKATGQIVKPACDRYRIVIPLSAPITDTDRYKALYFHLSNKYVNGMADVSAVGPERLHGFFTQLEDNSQLTASRVDGVFFDPFSVEVELVKSGKDYASNTQLRPSSRQAVCSMLSVIDPDLPYIDWCRVGWAIHHNFQSNPEDREFGEALYDEWSSMASGYDGTAIRKYHEFNPSRVNQSTIRTLRRMASDQGWWKGLISQPSVLASRMRDKGWLVTDISVREASDGTTN